MVDFKKLRSELLKSFAPGGALVAIEKGTSSLKICLASKGKESFIVEDFIVEDLSQVSPEGRLSFAKDLLSRFLSERNITQAKVYLVVEDDAIFSTRFSLPLLAGKELKQAVSWETKDSLPFPAEDAISDYHIINEIAKPDGTKSLDILYIALHKINVYESISLFEGLNVSLETVGIVPGSLLNILNLDTSFDVKDSIAILDIGYNHTSISIFKNKRLIFSRRVNIGSSDITQSLLGAVSTSRGVVTLSYNEAERIKQEYGVISGGQTIEIRNSDIDSVRLSSMMRPVLERLVAEVRNSFTYLSEKLEEGMVAKVYVTGGGSKLKNIDNFLSQQLGVPVEFLNIQNVVAFDPGIPAGKKAELPSLASTIGALLGNGKSLDFLPLEFRHKKREMAEWIALRMGIFTAVSVLSVSFLYLSIAHLIYANRCKQIALNELKLQELTNARNEIQVMENTLLSIKQGYPAGSVVMKELSFLTPSMVSIERIDYSETSGGSLKIKGYIRGDEKGSTPQLTRYIKALENSPLFQKVDLSSSIMTGADSEPMLTFSVSAKLEGGS